MNAEFDYDLTRDQWEALKALRLPAAERRIDESTGCREPDRASSLRP